jgi:hypothetical protein
MPFFRGDPISSHPLIPWPSNPARQKEYEYLAIDTYKILLTHTWILFLERSTTIKSQQFCVSTARHMATILSTMDGWSPALAIHVFEQVVHAMCYMLITTISWDISYSYGFLGLIFKGKSQQFELIIIGYFGIELLSLVHDFNFRVEQ